MDLLTRWRGPSRTARVRVTAAALAGLLIGPAAPAIAQAQPVVTEPEMKAAFLYKFGKFVDWPVQAFSSPSAPLELCVVGAESVGEALERTVRGKAINEHPLSVRRPALSGDLSTCHLVFVGAGDPRAFSRVVERLQDRPVLIVGEAPRAAGRGAAVNFVVEASRIRFEINPDAAERRGLRVSSKLLSLARLVRDGDGAS